MDRAKTDNDLSILKSPPDAHDMQNLAEAGFKTVVNLRQAGEQGEKLSPQAEAEEAREAGLEYLHYPVSPPDLSAAKAKDLAVRLEQLPGPVAIHCASGRRASLMGLASWAHQNNCDTSAAADRGRESGLNISEADLSPMFETSEAEA